MARITLVSTACRFRPRNYSVRRKAFLSNFVFWDIGTLIHQADRLEIKHSCFEKPGNVAIWKFQEPLA
jgi:hypothetical protein